MGVCFVSCSASIIRPATAHCRVLPREHPTVGRLDFWQGLALSYHSDVGGACSWLRVHMAFSLQNARADTPCTRCCLLFQLQRSHVLAPELLLPHTRPAVKFIEVVLACKTAESYCYWQLVPCLTHRIEITVLSSSQIQCWETGRAFAATHVPSVLSVDHFNGRTV